MFDNNIIDSSSFSFRERIIDYLHGKYGTDKVFAENILNVSGFTALSRQDLQKANKLGADVCAERIRIAYLAGEKIKV